MKYILWDFLYFVMYMVLIGYMALAMPVALQQVFENPLSNWTDVNKVMKRNQILDMTVRMLPPFGIPPGEDTEVEEKSSQENDEQL